MAEFKELKKMLDAALKQAGEESSMLLGQTLAVNGSELLNTNRQSYFTDMDDAIFVVGVESREEYPGRFYLLFSLGDTIVMSSILLGIPPARIAEKRRLCIMGDDDIDAFGEIANQIIGSFNSVFQPNLPNKVHLKLLPPQKFIPEIDQLTHEEPLPEGDYLMFRAPLETEGQEMHSVDIMVPLALANLFDPQQEQQVEPAPTTETADDGGGNPASAAKAGSRPETILILSEDSHERQMVKDCLASIGLQLVDAPIGADINDLLNDAEVKVAVIEVAETGERDLAVCNRINAQSKKAPLPIIMCAGEWTRTSVLKALKYGASDIIMKPIDAEELMAKVKRFLHAA